MARPKKEDEDRHVRISITLPPDLARRLKADPDGPAGAVRRMMRAEEGRHA